MLRNILVLVLANSFLLVNAQKGKVKNVEDDYRNFSYIKTSEVLLEVAENGYKSQDILQKLGNSFYFNNKMEEAAKWYTELFNEYSDKDTVIDAEYYFRYALVLKSIEDYEGSDKWMQKFYEIKPSDSRVKAFLSKVDYKSEIEALSNTDIQIKNLDINSVYSDFGTAEEDGGIVFASSRGGGKKYTWNNQSYLDLYVSKKDESGNFTEVGDYSSKVNTKFHESIVAYTQDERTMFFTRNNFFKKRVGKDDQGVNRLQLFRATKNENNQWADITPVHFNSKAYSVAHPTINKEGNRLYFASDMPGTIGQSDIYVVDINSDGTLGSPKNLGSSINTEGQESFPFINTSGDLYYSTNGFPGLGGRDIFVSRALDKKIIESSVRRFVVGNIGKPFNSVADDFGYYENLVTKVGFFSSNREGGKGDDDIYSFNIPDCSQVVNGIIKDVDTQGVISGATVILYTNQGVELERFTTGTDAIFSFNLECEQEYLVRAEKETYSSGEKRFTTPNKKQDLNLELLLDKDEQEIAPCDDLAKLLDIPIIYFDFDKYFIRKDAATELQKVLAVLKKYSTLNIDIRSHTDSRGTSKYNEVLSENRAKSTRQYLIDQGIDARRLTAKGYGENLLLNDCSDSVDCSENEHQKNRRSEFIVTSINGQDCSD